MLCQVEGFQLTDFLSDVGVLVVGANDEDDEAAEPAPAVALVEILASSVVIVMLLVFVGCPSCWRRNRLIGICQ